MKFRGSSTLVMPFSAVKSDEPFSNEDEDDGSDDPTTCIPLKNIPAKVDFFSKSIPFGSILMRNVLRVQLVESTIKVINPTNGEEIEVSRLPSWEREELSRHIKFAQETGRL